MSTIEALLESNQRFAASFEQARLPRAPAMRIAIVACMDARFSLDPILGLQAGDAQT